MNNLFKKGIKFPFYGKAFVALRLENNEAEILQSWLTD